MDKIFTLPAEKVKEQAKIKLEVCDHEVDMYWKVAIEVVEVIEENKKKGKSTFMIVH